jgi:hypothetical protein
VRGDTLRTLHFSLITDGVAACEIGLKCTAFAADESSSPREFIAAN